MPVLPRDLDEAMDRILESINAGKLAIFCGAGISRNSGLPMASEVKWGVINALLIIDDPVAKEILEELKAEKLKAETDEKEKKKVKESDWMRIRNYQFEYFMSTILNSIPSKNYLAGIYSGGNPNRIHYLLAGLARRGLVTEIMTTNFDTLLEDAEKRSGTDSVFEIYWNEGEFRENPVEIISVPLFKIHGSISRLGTIRTVLELISRNDLALARAPVLEGFWVEREQDILVLGYSFSDHFDVNKVLQSFSGRNQVYHIEHTSQ